MRQLGVLFWKNSILVRRRKWFVTLLEFALPLLLFTVYAVFFAKDDLPSNNDGETNKPFYFKPLVPSALVKLLFDRDVFYAPRNNFTDTLVSRASNYGKFHGIKGFDTEEELLMFNKTEQIVGLIFEGDAASSVNGQVPKKLDYKIRIRQNFETDTQINIRSKCPGYFELVQNPYVSTGFLGVQMVTNKAFIELAQSQEEQKPPENIHDQILLQNMPCPPYSYDQNPINIFPYLCMFSFLILCVTVTKRIVEEKQTGAKELMMLMGMEKWTFWVGWFIDALLVKALTIAFIVYILKTTINEHVILTETSPSLLFVMFFIYCASAIVFLFALSTFFSGPVFAMIVSLLVWMLPFAISSEKYLNSGFFTKCLYMLFPNMGLFFSFDSVIKLEERGVGAQWSNFYTSQSAQDVSILQVFIMYLIDIVLYSIITWYVSEVNPGEYGYKQPYLFFATKSYWFGGTNKKINLTKVLRLVEDPDILSKENYERPLTNNMADDRIGISVRNLTKSYPGKLGGPPVKAVRGVSLDIYKGEITALLGHNGAGKTTTMSILTGMISPSDGLVKVLGLDLNNNLPLLRKSIGLCPQHNLLFGELTVKQHLVFFAVLKGKSMKDAEIEAKELLRTFRLDSKMDALVSELSGGMKRKLQLAIALVGGSKVAILDEPTSGLDPEARREIWDILLSFRENKTILLSTHFMEEADVLGDTIAIMSHGRMDCCGSTMYLKRLFGAGYRLNLLTTNNCDQNSLQNAVKNVLPEAIVEKSSQDTTDSANRGPITFTLPTEKVDQFPRLFEVLETLKDDLGISSIGVSITTMEEVFLKVGDLSARKYDNKSLSDFDITNRGMDNPLITQTIKLTGIALFFEQFRALLVKKVTFSKKHWFLLLLQVLLPILLSVTAVLLSYPGEEVVHDSNSTMPLNLGYYSSDGTLKVLYESDSSNQTELFAKTFEENLRGKANAIKVDELQEKLIDIGTKSLTDYLLNYIVAAKITSENEALKVTGFYSFSTSHSAPISLNLMSNALLNYHLPSEYQISTGNQPIPLKKEFEKISYYSLVAATWLGLAHLGWIFATSINLILPLQERVLESKQLQMMTGCPAYLIWLSYFVIDALISSVVAILVLVVVYLVDTLHIFTSGPALGVLLSIWLLNGLCGTMFAYFISMVSDSVPSAFSLITILSIFIGIIINFVILDLESAITPIKYTVAVKTISGLILPHSTLISSLFHFSGTAAYNSICKIIPESEKKSICDFGSPFFMCCERLCENMCYQPASYIWRDKNYEGPYWPVKAGGIGQELICFTIAIVFWGTIVLMLDSGYSNRIFETVHNNTEQIRPTVEADGNQEDEDVREERKRVDKNFESPIADSVLAVKSLQKRFGQKDRFFAVKGVSFRVERGECFGLLGVNGAGKSTTFKMLTGAVRPTNGDASLRQFTLKSELRKFLTGIGYCPQTNAQLGVLTGRETLHLFARLRGMPRDQIKEVVNKWLVALGLMEYANRPAGTYSGGNQRKLSAGIALIGESPVVLLDEPTSGVDPAARRQLWQVLASCQKAGQSIVLTSHNMDECEALCSRLAIMVAGKLVCLGPIGHLKNKFGQGYTLMVKVQMVVSNNDDEATSLAVTQLSNLKNDIQMKFAPCELIDEHIGFLHYQLKGTGRKWAEMFKEMQSLKNMHTILEDYTLSETTLEQLFLSFAQQRDPIIN
ncbi:phospholipid-transporting ATPase ABCA1-like [Cloeon dipterum]|uniref:phospholipid-transporting ATPase ABCA1-like n=1 Tax=Cloeon dipterum TaxID=197152 RepID=UPI00321F6ADA